MSNRVTVVLSPAEATGYSLPQRIQTGGAFTKHPTEWVAGALSKRIKLPERKVNPPVFRVKFKNKWNYTSIPSRLSGA
jgi:hypothetical protein